VIGDRRVEQAYAAGEVGEDTTPFLPAVFPLTVLLTRTSSLTGQMPPPSPTALFPLTVGLMRISVPEPKSPWPMPPPLSALFPLTATLVSVKVPSRSSDLLLKTPPPQSPRPPLRIVTPLMLSVPDKLAKTPAVGRIVRFPSMIVVDAPLPVIVTLPVMAGSSARIVRR